MAAMALITDPALVIFDEPTTALDVTTQIEVLKAFKDAVRDLGTTAVYVTHDLSVVAQIADRIVVLRGGEVQELGTTQQILFAPRHNYAQALVAAAAPEPASSRHRPTRRRCSICGGSSRVMGGRGRTARLGPKSSTGSMSRSGVARCWASSADPAVARARSRGWRQGYTRPRRAASC
jgi:ABC-type glutathione transport system ATPase component